jgi:hypothetical protein
MKYLSKRDNYLKKISERRELSDDLINRGIKRIYENQAGSGVLGNEINWGDSLLGRLINSVLRKAQEGINTMKMSVLVKRFKAHFEYILGMSGVNSLDESERFMVARFQLSVLMDTLTTAVEEGKELDEIIGLCSETMDGISTLNVGDDLKSEKEDLLKKLKDFKEFLSGLKSGESSESGESENSEDSYQNYVNNFKVVLRLCEAYMALKKNNSNLIPDKSAIKVGNEYVYKNQKGETKKVKIISLSNTTNYGPDKKWLTSDDVKTKPLSKGFAFVAFQDIKGEYTQSSMAVPIRSLSSISESYKLYESSEAGNFMSSLKSLYGFVVNYIKVYEISGILKMNLNDNKYKTPISKIYSVVKSSNGVNENIDNLLTRPEEIGKKISQLYSITKTKPDGGFEGVSPEMQKLVQEFNSTMAKCLTKSVTENEPETQKESIIKSYSSFLKINELVKNIKTSNLSDDIKDYFSEKFDLSKWEVKQEDVEKIDNRLKEVGKKVITIRGTGPILEVVRFFNRAYKIHTRNAIPFSGRSDGKLNVTTMNQWTAFGASGVMKGKGDGPYRNNKLFNMWENAVYDIFKEYEEVFDKGTTLIIGDRKKLDAGKALREFMLDMLDGDELYKSDGGKDGGSAQKKAINKYFDIDEKGIKTESISISSGNGNDLKTNVENATNIKESKMSFVERPDGIPGDPKSLVGSFFALSGKDDKGEIVTRYFYINSIDSGLLYITHTRNTWFYQKYLSEQNGPKMTIVEKDGIGRPMNGPSGSGLHLTKIGVNEFLKLKVGNKIKINSKNINSEDKTFQLTIDKRLFLSKEGEGNKWSFYKISDFDKLNRLLNDTKMGFKKPLSINPGKIEFL